MSDIIATTGQSVNTLTAEIVAISNQAAQMAYYAMVEIGKRLVAVKEQLPHGEWGDYLKNEVKFSQSTANNFMRIFKRSSEANSQTFANLGYSHIVKLLALPDEELSEFAESHDVQSMSARQLEQAIAEERRAREAAEKRAAAAEGALETKTAALQKKVTAAEKAKESADKLVQKYRDHPQIPDSMKAQLIEAGRSQAANEIRAEYQAQLDNALAGKATAEKMVQDLQAGVAADKKAEKMSDPDVIRFNDLGKQILDDLNRLDGYRLRIVAHNPEMDAKLRAYLAKMAAIVNKRYAPAATSGGEAQ